MIQARADEAARTRLEDIQHAVEVLREAAEHCDEREMRSEAVDAALDYLSSIASRRAALLAFGRGLAMHTRNSGGRRSRRRCGRFSGPWRRAARRRVAGRSALPFCARRAARCRRG